MTLRTRLLTLVLSLLPLGAPRPCDATAAFAQPERGEASALFVTTGIAHDAALDALAAALRSDYGVSENAVRTLRDHESGADAIEQTLFERLLRLKPRDTLVVVLALALHDKGTDRVLVTGDFDSTRPWTGLPTTSVREIAASAGTGTVVIFAPDCGGASPANLGIQEAATYKTRPSGGEARATVVGFCAADSGALDSFLRDLAIALTELAREPGTRAPWQGAGQGGLVGVADLVSRMAAADRRRGVTADPAAGGWLTVVTATPTATATQPFRALRAANTAVAVREALVTLLAGVRVQNGANVAAIAQGLARYATDSMIDADWRGLAVQALGDLPRVEAQQHLKQVYEQTEASPVRTLALQEWQSLQAGDPPTLPREALRDGDPRVQIAAIQLLAAAGDASSRGAFQRSITDSVNASVRISATRALAMLPEEADTATLIAGKALTDGYTGVRIEAASALARLKPSATVADALLTALRDRESSVVEAAAYATAAHWSAAPPATGDALFKALVDQALNGATPNERVAALWALARSGRREQAAALLPVLDDERADAAVRVAAIEALAALGDVAAVSVLVRIARAESGSNESRERLAAVRALGRLDNAQSVDTLLTIAAAGPDGLREATLSGPLAALTVVTPLTLAMAANRCDFCATGVLPVGLRLQVIDLLGRSDRIEVARALVKLLDEPDVEVRLRAARSFASHHPEKIVDILAALLRAPPSTARISGEDVRVAAAIAVGAMRGPATNTILLNHIDDVSPAVRRAVVGALDGATLTVAQAARLAETVHDDDVAVRRDAVARLREAGEAVGLDTPLAGTSISIGSLLQQLARDDADEVRADAIASLRESSQAVRGDPSQGGSVVYRAPLRPDQRGMRIDVFWCASSDEDAAAPSERARKFAGALAVWAPSMQEKGDTITAVRLRPLGEHVNRQPGYRVTHNQIRYEAGDAREVTWLERLQSRWPAQFAAYPVANRTADYLSVFFCGHY